MIGVAIDRSAGGGVIYGSVCTGIGSAELAWAALGWRAAFVSEIEAFPRAVLERRLGAGSGNGPDLRGDFTAIQAGDHEPIELLVGGTPCQSFSVAGKRLGLDDPRGNLAIEFLGLAGRLRPRWLVFENVPGLLSSDGGRDFGAFLGLLGQCGYGFAYRVLDAQYVRVDGLERAVPQRRRRVFVVGYSGDWRPAAAVLLEPEGLRGDPAPRRQAGERAARPIAGSSDKGGGYRLDADRADDLSAYCGEAGRCLEAHPARMDGETDTYVSHALLGEGFDASEDGTGRGTTVIPILEVGKGSSSRGAGPNGSGFGKDGDPMFTLQGGAQHAIAFSCKDHGADAREGASPTLRAMGHDGSHANAGGQVAVAFDTTQITSPGNRSTPKPGDACHTLAGGAHPPALVAGEYAVRRLTPRECERLQGLPEHWTRIPWRGRPAERCPDGPRYRAIGNAMAVNVMRWIGGRIEAVEAVLKELLA